MACYRRGPVHLLSPSINTLVAVTLILSGCQGQTPTRPTPGQHTQWEPVGTLAPIAPADAGLDQNGMVRLVSDIRAGTYGELHSLLVVRRGRLAVEEYFNGSHAEDLHTLQSVSKSVSSALVGIAIDQGVLGGVSDRVLDYFPQWRDTLASDARRANMRLGDILTMRTGVDYTEGFDGSPHSQLNALTTGWDRFWLERPMRVDPGGTFNYDSGGVIALSGMFKQRTGAHADVFAETHLFGPLGITQSRWFQNQEGHPHLGGGLRLRALDIARFGQMYLQRGRWGSRQVVPASWVAASFSEQVRFPAPLRRYTGYGYLWWRLPPGSGGTQTINAAAGNLGQFIFVIHELDAVVVVTAGLPGEALQVPVEMLYNRILPLFRPTP